jgi:hypothetical protein
MERPILEILEASRPLMQGPFCTTEAWRERIEKYAPGYLAMEEAGKGMAPDYDHANLVTE